MPVFQLKTLSSKSVWRSPDGQREIWEVMMDYQGQALKAKTYSEAISVVGWSGEAETYEKEGRNGVETFVKQPPKETNYNSRGSGGSAASKPAFVPKDEKAIHAQFAIREAINWLTSPIGKEGATLADVEPLANDLFAMIDRVKTGEVKEFVPDPIITELEDGPVDMSKLNDIFGPPEDTETPWPIVPKA